MAKENFLEAALVDETTAAEFLCLKVATLRRWRWAGTGPVWVKLGGAVRYRVPDLETYVLKNTQLGPNEPSEENRADR